MTKYTHAVMAALVAGSLWVRNWRKKTAEAHLRFVRDAELKAQAQPSEFAPIPQLPAYSPRPPNSGTTVEPVSSSLSSDVSHPVDLNIPQIPPPTYSAV